MSREMKDSGVEWIGEIPTYVHLEKVKWIFNIGRGRVIPITDMDDTYKYPVYSSQTKNNGIMGYINSFDFDRSQLTWTTDGANAGTVFLREGKHNCTNVCGTLFPKTNAHSLRYLKYALEYIAVFHKRADTNGYKIMNNEMAEISVPIFPYKEQEHIACHLDKQILKIDTIIDSTQSTIEDYKLLKQSIITEAVTKGLDKNVEMKDSGVDWIGGMPNHWHLSKLKYEFRIKKDIAGTEGYDILSVTQKGLKVKDITVNEGQMAADYSKYQFVTVGDYVMNHMDLLTGWVDYSAFNGVTSPDYRVFYMKNPEKNSPEYYKYIFQTCYKNKVFYGLAQGVSNLGRWRLQADKFLNFYIPIPPKEEQDQITDYIVSEQKRYDEIINKKEMLLIELEQYKKSIIYEYVTGKKEVE